MWRMSDALQQFAPGSADSSTDRHATPLLKAPYQAQPPLLDHAVGKPSFSLRSYQKRIAAEAVKANTIIVLPTGAGKTLIAAEVILRLGGPALFLVPTVLLVEQQVEAIRSWTRLSVQPFSGGSALPLSFDILVCTPQAFYAAQQDLQGAAHIQWSRFRAVIFDEVHHLLKEHPYRKLALNLRSCVCRPRVVGLTASYTYAVNKEQVRAVLQRMCDELRATHLETASEDELRECGYMARTIPAEVLEDLTEDELPQGVLPVDQRRPHLMMQLFFTRVLEAKATPFGARLAKCVLRMEMTLKEMDPSFSPPIQTSLPLKQWGSRVHRLAPLKPPGVGFMYAQLEHWYEALRVLIVSWEEDEYASVLYLQMLKCDTCGATNSWPMPVADGIREFWAAAPKTFPRLDKLRRVLLEKKRNLQDFRGLIFVQQRITTHILEHYIDRDPELFSLFSTAVVYASSSPATPSFSVSKSEAKARVEAFGTGAVNLLIATVVAEEGMDIPAANCVIRFDAMQHTVSLVQGRGRARQENSAFVVLRERHDRSATSLAAMERQQLALIRDFQPEVASKIAVPDESTLQQTRERCAKPTISAVTGLSDALEYLELFCTRTKVPLQCSYEERSDGYGAIMCYDSILRNVTACGLGRTRKEAANEAALQVVASLKRQLQRSYG